MPCPDGAVCPRRAGEIVTDYHRFNIYPPARIYTPTSKRELVAAVIDIESDGLKAKAIGSNMSFSPVARSDACLIETHALDKHLSLPRGAGSVPWAPGRFRDGVVVDRLVTMIAPSVLDKQPRLVYVESGIKIRDLLADLAAIPTPGLALPAMGAGGAQSLAGALATGTHGAEMDRQPLMDSIRAVHLVAAGGQEWWIERSNGLTEHARLVNSVPDWCADTRVVYDDRLFYSALVSVGRLGVIYALILEVEEAYWLDERRTREPYAPVRERLVASATNGFTSATGIMSTRGAPGLMFLGIVLNVNSQANCWVMERRIHLGPQTEVGTSKASLATNGLCTRIPLFAPPTTVAEFLELYLGSVPQLSNPLMEFVLDQVEGQPAQRTGPSHTVMDQMDYSAPPPECSYGDQSEFFFNARTTLYLDFVDQLIEIARTLGGVPGYVNMRFTQHSDAYIGMSQFPMTVGVEVVALPSRPSDQLLLRAGLLAESLGGIPHWGKRLIGVPRSTSLFPKNSVECYRYGVALTEEGRPSTFSSEFTRIGGLEPDPGVPVRQLDERTAHSRVSLRELFASAQTRLAMPETPKSILEVARQFAPSLRMNADGVSLPRGRAAVHGPRVRLRDLSRRLGA
jgi:hypothetical protein